MHIAAQEMPNDCSKITSLTLNLRSRSDVKRASAKKAILLISSKSESSRQCAIQRMLDIASLPTTRSDKARILFLTIPASYSEWVAAIDILGEMRATEALDTLINCLDCNDGKSTLGIGLFPAALSLVKFGDQAIPKLEEALRQKPPGIRLIAVRTLPVIGGEKARQILSDALKTETDQSVADTIKNMLLGWNASAPRKK
jgi:HEAT repeat protein